MVRRFDSATPGLARSRRIARHGPPTGKPTPTRTFLVGCPRSGTTFLQAALAAHPGVYSVPETAFLERILPGRVDRVVSGLHVDEPRGAHRRARAFFRFRRRAQRHLRHFAAELGIRLDARDTHVCVGGFLGAFADVFDRAAIAHGCMAWIEKTPNHVFYLDVIERHVANARFIHLLRGGEDVVASIVDASLRYSASDHHQVFSQGVAWWIAYWNAAIETHSSHAGARNHCIVFYEDLVEDFDNEYARVCEFIGVEPWSAIAAPTRVDSADQSVADTEREPWKQDAMSGDLRPALRKFESIFGPEARQWIRRQLLPYDEIRAHLDQRGTAASTAAR